MNNVTQGTNDELRAFQLLSEVAEDGPVSQRELAQRLGIALGLVNSYIKNFIAKGYIRVRNYPRNRFGYLLTPQGLAEKARLAYQHVNYFTSLYTVTRDEFRQLFHELAARQVNVVCFCGVDEVAEIAWLSLQESGIRLGRVYDTTGHPEQFMGVAVETLGGTAPAECIIITSVKRRDTLFAELLRLGVEPARIFVPSSSFQGDRQHVD